MKFFKKPLNLFCLLLFCITQTGCGLLEIPIDLLGAVGSAVGTAVSVGVAAAPYAAPFFM
jgi:hypothetical protein